MRKQKATRTDNRGSRSVKTDRLFIAAKIPAEVKSNLAQNLKQYAAYIRRLVDQGSWHMTCCFIGQVANGQDQIKVLTQDMPQIYLPTVTLTHLGRGRQENQLWAFAKPTVCLVSLQRQLNERLRKGRAGWSLRSVSSMPGSQTVGGTGHAGRHEGIWSDWNAAALGQSEAEHGLPGAFVPHIKLADLREHSVSKLVADTPLTAVWRIKKLLLWRSIINYTGARYEVVGEIRLEER